MLISELKINYYFLKITEAKNKSDKKTNVNKLQKE